MEAYGRNLGRGGGSMTDLPPPADWAPVGPDSGLEESMRRLGLLSRVVYPERVGVAECAYYMRTGTCGYGNKCRFHHPRDRSSIEGSVRAAGGDFPERVGEPECQYYLRTGTCKFGASCKFHHPRNGGGSLNDVPVNIYGYPLRPGEKECSYYLKTGHCKFRLTCKFNHPHLGDISEQTSLGPFYSIGQSSAPSPEQFEGSTSYNAARPPVVPGSYVPGAYGPLLLPPGMVPLPNWSAYSGPVSPVMSPGAQPSVGPTSLYGIAQISSSHGFAGPYAPVLTSAGPSSNTQTMRSFPERPGQPECQYYMKTGDCKFGSSCKYHHPPDWVVSRTNCVLSHIGLPLRPGVQPCGFYLQNGYCKFGQTCKFDHPVEASNYNPSASSLADMAVAPYVLPSSPGPISFSKLRPEFISGPKLDSITT